MKTVGIDLYTIDELSDSAKEKARDWYRECFSWDNHWSEYVIDEAIEQGNLLGIEFKTRDVPLRNGKTRQEPLILWSGFCCQGDGACFEGTWKASDVKAASVADGWGDDPTTTELKRIATCFEAVCKNWPEASFKVVHSGHYSHKYSTSFEVSLDPENGDNFPEPEASYDPECVIHLNYMDERAKYDERWCVAEKELIETARDFMEWIYRQLEVAYNDANSDEQIDDILEMNDFTFLKDGTRFNEK